MVRRMRFGFLVVAVTVAAAATIASGTAATELQLFGSEWETDEYAGAAGVGFGVSVPVSGRFALDFRAVAFEDLAERELPELEARPLEAGVRWDVTSEQRVTPYVGGGLSYALLDGAAGTAVDDELGLYLMGGARFPLREHLGVFLEAAYRDLEAEVTVGELDQIQIAPAPFQQVRREVDLTGFSLQAGVSWSL